MIPKIIHYCWFGDKELSPLNKACIKSWKEFLPTYEIQLWNESNIPDNPYLLFALKHKKYAFAADYARFYALNKYGGIYMDTDMELIKPLDNNILLNKFFSGYEDIQQEHISCGILGSIPNHIVSKKMLMHYDKSNEFINVPLLLTNTINSINQDIRKNIAIYPNYFFYPYNPFDNQQSIKQLMFKNIHKDTYSIHHWEYSWKPSLIERFYNHLHKLWK